jgi:hypothetical protein
MSAPQTSTALPITISAPELVQSNIFWASYFFIPVASELLASSKVQLCIFNLRPNTQV